MALKIILKAGEQVILGGAVVRNGNTSATLFVENNVPLLRQKDIMTEDEADTPCKRIYLVIQLMYVDERNLRTYHNTYWGLVRDLLDAAPSMLAFIDAISDHILNYRYYHALKTTKKLIEYEREVMNHARNVS